jgi:hypothetical protein
LISWRGTDVFWLVKILGGRAAAGVVEEIRLSEETDGDGWHNSSSIENAANSMRV